MTASGRWQRKGKGRSTGNFSKKIPRTWFSVVFLFRLTLVKGWNTEEMDNYAKLVEIGKPDFIEVKGVTYCGTSKGIAKLDILKL